MPPLMFTSEPQSTLERRSEAGAPRGRLCDRLDLSMLSFSTCSPSLCSGKLLAAQMTLSTMPLTSPCNACGRQAGKSPYV